MPDAITIFYSTLVVFLQNRLNRPRFWKANRFRKMPTEIANRQMIYIIASERLARVVRAGRTRLCRDRVLQAQWQLEQMERYVNSLFKLILKRASTRNGIMQSINHAKT
jgi:hypothetical protein